MTSPITDFDALPFLAFEYETTEFVREGGMVTARRSIRWTVPDDFCVWEPYQDGEPDMNISFGKALVLLRTGKIREMDGALVARAEGKRLTASEVLAKLHRPVTDEELAILNAKLAAERTPRPCCPQCWGFGLERSGGKASCECGWQGKTEELHRRPAK